MGHLSIDVRQDSLKLLETDGSLKSFKIKNFRVLESGNGQADLFANEDTVNLLSGALGKVLTKEKFTRDPAGLALGSSYCIFRDLELPFKNDDQIRKVIKFEVEGSIQTDIDDMVISYFKKMETVDKSHLMVLAVKKAILSRVLEILQTRDVDPYFVDLDLLCIYNALSATGYLHEMETFFVVNCSTDITHILALSRGRLVSARSIPLGVNGMIKALNHELIEARIPEQESVEEFLGITPLSDFARSIQNVGEDSQDGEIAAPAPKQVRSYTDQIKKLADQRRSDFLGKLRREILRTLTSMQLKDKTEKVLVTGIGCSVPGFQDLCKEIISAECEELDLLSRVDHPFDEKQAIAANREIAVPLGSAYKLAGHNITKVDMRQEELVYAKKFDQVKVPTACLVFLLLIFVVLLNLELYMYRKWEMDEISAITHLAKQKLSKALGDNQEAEAIAARFDPGLRRVDGIARAIQAKSKELGNELGREGTIPELPSVFPVWYAFFSTIEKHEDDIELFKLNKLRIRTMQKTPVMTFDCEVASAEDESKLEELLNKVPIFTRVMLGKSTPGSIGRTIKDTQVEIDLTKLEPKR
jgi:hypothetical protein